MIWRLMASILVMSDTGSLSLVTDHTDWPDEVSCRQIMQSHYTPPAPREFNGHLVTAKISASCVPVFLDASLPPPAGPPVGLPPPIAQILPRFFPGCMGSLGPCEPVQ